MMRPMTCDLILPPGHRDPQRQAETELMAVESRFLALCGQFREVGTGDHVAVDALIHAENAAALHLALVMLRAKAAGAPARLRPETVREIGRRSLTLTLVAAGVK